MEIQGSLINPPKKMGAAFITSVAPSFLWVIPFIPLSIELRSTHFMLGRVLGRAKRLLRRRAQASLTLLSLTR